MIRGSASAVAALVFGADLYFWTKISRVLLFWGAFISRGP